MTLPKISIITPSYNQGEFLEKTIQSVLSQNYPNLEFIIIDGGSSDNSVDVIKKYQDKLTYWVSEADNGQSHAINKGMAKATGDILTWLNSDDWYLSGTLHYFAQSFQENPDVDIIVGAGRIIDQKGKETYYKAPDEQITLKSLYLWTQGGNFMQPSSVFSKKAWQLAGPIDESIHIAMDLDLWLKMAKHKLQFLTTDQLLSEALSHPAAKTTAYNELTHLDCSLVITEHGGKTYIEQQLIQNAHKLGWYQQNYNSLINHPLIKLIRPLVKRLAKNPDDYWRDIVPPWVKDE